MLPRRRNIGGVTDRTPLLENDQDSYDKLGKKGYSKPYPSLGILSHNSVTENSRREFVESEIKLDFFDEPLFEPVMAARDRTNEFVATVRSLQGRTLARPVVKDESKAVVLETYSQFMSMAKVISKNITSTYTKLEKLAMLAKKKSLFDDRPTEIQELTYIIKGDLSALNQQIARLGEMPRGRRSMHNHSSSVVLSLQSRLASMSNQFKQRPKGSHYPGAFVCNVTMQDSILSTILRHHYSHCNARLDAFIDVIPESELLHYRRMLQVLEVRSENLKQQNSRREQFSRVAPVVKEVPSLLQQDEVSIDVGETSNQSLVMQTQQLALRDDTDSYVQQRAETMHNIESTIVELGGIFQQLAHMVKEQDEAIGRIDANIHESEMNVEAGHREIMKYFQSVTGNRALMFKVFGVLIFFFIFFVVVMA